MIAFLFFVELIRNKYVQSLVDWTKCLLFSRVQTRPFTRQRQSRSVQSERSGGVTDEEEYTSVALTLRGISARVTTPCQMLWVSSWLTFQIWWPACPPSKSRPGLQSQTQKRWENTWVSGPPHLAQFHYDLPLYGYRIL